MQQSKNRARVLGRRLARELTVQEIAMISGGGRPYDKELLNCETCVTCVGGKVDIGNDW